MRDEIAAQLLDLVTVVTPRLSRMTGDEAGPGTWTVKEILGHLIDSAANNHQRFVRAQLTPLLVFPGYEQEAWNTVQAYGDEPWPDLIALWASYNRHLAHVIRSIPGEAAVHRCEIGGGEPVTLDFLVTDYVRHLRHHLDQIITRGSAA